MRREQLHPQRPSAIGIDIGRVIIAPVHDDGTPDTHFLGAPPEEALAVPPAPGAFATIAEIFVRFAGRVWLVSKAGPQIQQMTLLWLREHRFHELTRLPERHVRFCRARSEKRDHALKLGLTHFIDDRVDVLRPMKGIVPNLYLFGHQTGVVPSWVTPARDWTVIRGKILAGETAP